MRTPLERWRSNPANADQWRDIATSDVYSKAIDTAFITLARETVEFTKGHRADMIRGAKLLIDMLNKLAQRQQQTKS